MPEKLRINGFDLYNLSRLDDINQTKVERGMSSNTLEPVSKNKSKLYASVFTDVAKNTLLESMLLNPHYAVSVVEGLEHKKYLFHGYRFKHSVGEIDFIDFDAIRFRDYGIKVDAMLLDRDNLEYFIDEDFSTSANWALNAMQSHGVSSYGGSLQTHAWVWVSRSGTAVSTDNTVGSPLYINGYQKLALSTNIIVTIAGTRRFSNYEISTYVYNTSASGSSHIILSYSGKNDTVDNYISFVLNWSSNTAYIYTHDGSVPIQYFSLPDIFTLTANVYYKIRLVVEDILVHAFIDNYFIGTVRVDNMFNGDLGLTSGNYTTYVDQFRVKRVARRITGVPPNAFTDEGIKSIDVDSSIGTSEIVYNVDKVTFSKLFSKDSVIKLDFNKTHGNKIIDKTTNSNDASVRGGNWDDGYLNDAIVLKDGDIIIEDDASYTNLSEFNLHMRFKLKEYEKIKASTQVNPIAQKGSEFAVYDYKKSDGEVIHFKFQDNVIDEVQNSTLDVRIGTIGYGDEGILDKYIDFDGATSLILKRADIPDFKHGSCSFWIKPLVGTGTQYVLRHYDSASSRLYVYYNGSNLVFQFGNAVSVVAPYTVGTWSHYTVTWEDSIIKCYMDGVLIDVGLGTGFTGIDEDIYIGGNITSSFYTGYMDDLRFFNRALDANEAKQIYENGYDDLKLHRLAFEMNGDWVVGDVIEEDEWVEAWFLNDGQSISIFRRDLVNQEIIPEARKYLGECAAYYPLDAYEATATDKSINNGYLDMSSGMNTVTSRMGGGVETKEGQTYLEYFSISEANGASRMVYTGNYDLSFSWWVKLENTGNTGAILSKAWNSSAEYNYKISLSSATLQELELSMEGTGSAITDTSVSYVFEYEKWHMLTFTIDSRVKVAKLYVDAQEVCSIDISSITFVPDNPDLNEDLTIATLYPYGHTWASTGLEGHMAAGDYSDFRVYNRVLSDAERRFLFSKQDYADRLFINSAGLQNHSVESGLIMHHLFQNDVLDDTINDNDGTSSGITYATGKVRRGASFTGGSYMLLPNSVRDKIAGDYKNSTIAFWMYIDEYTPDGTNGYILAHPASGNVFHLKLTDDGKLSAIIGDSTVVTQTTTVFSLSTWYHVVVKTYKNVQKIYVNGVLDVTGSISPFTSSTKTTAVVGALNTTPSQWFAGDLDDFRVYTYNLSQREINSLYNAGNGTEKRSYKTLFVDEFDLQDKFYLPYKYLDSNFQVRCWSLGEDDVQNPSMKSLIFHGDYEEGAGLKTILDKINDDTPYMTQINSASTTRWGTSFSPFRKYSLFLTAQDDWQVDIDYHQNLTNSNYLYEFTLSAWVKCVEPEQGGGNSYIWYNNTGGSYGLIVSLNYGIPNKVMVVIGDGTSSAWYYMEDVRFSPYTWHKFDLTFQNGVILAYVDGELVDKVTTAYTRVEFDSAQYLRHDGYDADYYIAHTKYLDRTLTPEEIKLLYVSDPITPYYKGELVMNSRTSIDKNSTLFIENGLFALKLFKAGTIEAYSSTGEAQTFLWDKGWKKSGKLGFEDQEGL